jgi:hypothetical protein
MPSMEEKKGGAKAHMIVKAENMVPEFVQITEAIKNDKDIFPLFKASSRSHSGLR